MNGRSRTPKEPLTAATSSAFDSLAIAGVFVVQGIVAVFMPLLFERWLHRCYQAHAPTFDERVSPSGAALQRPGATLTDVESEIRECQHPGDRRREGQTALELTRGEVEEITQLLRGELRREGRRTFWVGVAQSTVFFVLGTAVTIAVALLTSGGATHR